MREDAGGACDGSRARTPLGIIHFDGNAMSASRLRSSAAQSRVTVALHLNLAHLGIRETLRLDVAQ